jgi:hypothetical protein
MSPKKFLNEDVIVCMKKIQTLIKLVINYFKDWYYNYQLNNKETYDRLRKN